MQRLKNLLLLISILALIIFSLTQFYTRQAYQQQLEANYQRAFRELTVHINGIEEELAKIQVVNSVELQAEIWANILRLVYSAQANLGQLPLNGLNLSRIEHLLASIQDKTVDFTRRNIRNETQVEETTLTELYLQVKYVNSELQKQLAEKGQTANWVNWKNFLQTSMLRSSNIEPGRRHPLMHSLVMVEDGMQRFSNSDFPSETDRLQGTLPRGELISPQEAVAIAEQFLQELAAGKKLQVVNESAGSLPTFTVQTVTEKDPYPITIEIAKYGGHVLWMTNGRIVSQSELDRDTLIGLAQDFLARRNFPEMRLVNASSRLNRLFLDFVPVEDQVLIYPQQLKLQVAEDNGQILGFQGQAYYGLQASRELSPQLTLAEARAKVKQSENIQAEHLAVILNPSFEEVLTYEFRVHQEPEEFLVYINAKNGHEEKVSRLHSR